MPKRSAPAATRARTRTRTTDRRPPDNRPPTRWTPTGPRNGLRLVDFLCGAGGASLGMANAGWELVFGANHWQVAIDTHMKNFPGVWHECVDVTTINLRCLPPSHGLWISPICTEASPAGGNAAGWRESDASQRGQGSLWEEEPVAQAGLEKTRATFWEAIRYAEIWRPLTVIVENVPDVIKKWALFKNWLGCMETLGYSNWQAVSVNSAHIGDPELGIPYAPQWRDRLYIVFIRDDIRREPDVTPRPLSMCFTCRDVVRGVQTWCPAAESRWLKVGRYRRDPTSTYGSYWYTCPRGCRDGSGTRARVEPYVLPAAAAVDWTDLGAQIADGQLVRNSLNRIAVGQGMFWDRPADRAPFVANTNHDDTRLYLANGQPLTARTTKIGDGMVSPPAPDAVDPFLAIWRNNVDASGIGDPMPTLTAAGHHHSLVSPPPDAFQVTHCGGEARPENLCNPIHQPMGTVVASGLHHGLVLPYYSKDPVYTTGEPLGTVSTREHHAIIPAPAGPAPMREVRAKDGGTVRMRDCRHRMIRWDEAARAQVLPVDAGYVITGTGEEKTAQAGNAVSGNASQWLGNAVAAVLCPA